METQHLEAFIAVAEAGSFSRAADRIHLTQPAISKRIALLEQDLECRLFDRIGRHIDLTQAGHALLPRARELLLSIDETRQQIRDLSGIVSGSLRLAISHHIGLHRLPPILQRFTCEHPEVALDIDFMDSEIAYEAVRLGEFEMAVITLAPESHNRIAATVLWHDPLQLVCGRAHPLATLGRVTLATLSAHAAILPGLNTYTGQMIKAHFDRHRKTLNATMATNYLETIKMMVSVGLGWSLLPTTMLDATLAPLDCKQLALTRELGYIHHQERSLSNAARRFIELLHDEP
ncbi:MAG TPA: LysR family transcriptional regulator [Porticoccaceae bacterium]|nr:LysR family transcriptional regulator [Porticoccaceae bacterium]